MGHTCFVCRISFNEKRPTRSSFVRHEPNCKNFKDCEKKDFNVGCYECVDYITEKDLTIILKIDEQRAT